MVQRSLCKVYRSAMSREMGFFEAQTISITFHPALSIQNQNKVRTFGDDTLRAVSLYSMVPWFTGPARNLLSQEPA